MSQMAVARTARIGSTQARALPRRRASLRVVDATPKTRSHAGFVVLCLALVVGGLLSALLPSATCEPSRPSCTTPG